MTTTFPTSLDTFFDPDSLPPGQYAWLDGTIRDAPTDPANILSTQAALLHTTEHGHGNDALLAAQTKVGIDGSLDTTSLDYKITHITPGGFVYKASFGDASPATIFTVPLGSALDRLTVEVTETWNGTGASVTVGTVATPDLLFDTTDTVLDALATFDKDTYLEGSVAIILTIVTGVGASQGKVTIQGSVTKGV